MVAFSNATVMVGDEDQIVLALLVSSYDTNEVAKLCIRVICMGLKLRVLLQKIHYKLETIFIDSLHLLYM